MVTTHFKQHTSELAIKKDHDSNTVLQTRLLCLAPAELFISASKLGIKHDRIICGGSGPFFSFNIPQKMEKEGEEIEERKGEKKLT